MLDNVPAVVSFISLRQLSPAIWAASMTDLLSASVKKQGTYDSSNNIYKLYADISQLKRRRFINLQRWHNLRQVSSGRSLRSLSVSSEALLWPAQCWRPSPPPCTSPIKHHKTHNHSVWSVIIIRSQFFSSVFSVVLSLWHVPLCLLFLKASVTSHTQAWTSCSGQMDPRRLDHGNVWILGRCFCS